MLTPGSALHAGDAVAAQALQAAAATYAELAGRACPAGPPVVLDGASLIPGIYCFPGDATLNSDADAHRQRAVDLQGRRRPHRRAGGHGRGAAGPAGTCAGAASSGRSATPSAATLPLAVTIGAGAAVRGNILAQGPIAIGRRRHARRPGDLARERPARIGGSVDAGSQHGRPPAASASRCRPRPRFKVTGGGSIDVPDDPAVTDPDATGGG